MSTKNDTSNNCQPFSITMCEEVDTRQLWKKEVFETTFPQRYSIPSGFDPSTFEIRENDRCMNDYLLKYLLEEVDRKSWSAPSCLGEQEAPLSIKDDSSLGLPYWEMSKEAKREMIRLLCGAPSDYTEQVASFIVKDDSSRGLPCWEISAEAKSEMILQIQLNAITRSALFMEGVLREEERSKIVYSAFGRSIVAEIFKKTKEAK